MAIFCSENLFWLTLKWLKRFCAGKRTVPVQFGTSVGWIPPQEGQRQINPIRGISDASYASITDAPGILPKHSHDYDKHDYNYGQYCSTNQYADEKADPSSFYFDDRIHNDLPVDNNPEWLAINSCPVFFERGGNVSPIILDDEGNPFTQTKLP